MFIKFNIKNSNKGRVNMTMRTNFVNNIIKPSYAKKKSTFSRLSKQELMNFMYVTNEEETKFIIYGINIYDYFYVLNAFLRIDCIIDDSKSDFNSFLGHKVVRKDNVGQTLNNDKDKIRIIVFSDQYAEVADELVKSGLNPFTQIFDGRLIFGGQENVDNSNVKNIIFSGHFGPNSSDGGIFLLDGETNSVKKLAEGRFVGLCRYQDGYLAVLEQKAILYFDKNFSLIKQINIDDENSNTHGVDFDPADPNFIYVVETGYDRISVYDVVSSIKVEQIEFGDGMDARHINDILVTPQEIFVSMFSIRGIYHLTNWANDGAIVSLNKKNYCIDKVVAGGLNGPHTIQRINNNMLFCDSYMGTVKCDNQILCRFNGFTRGICYDGGNTLFIGQSKPRHLTNLAQLHPNFSSDSGIHCFIPSHRLSKFIPVRDVSQIYSIILP